jgi:molybdopterin-guanine dinucleotide biosynthesis protein A
MGGGHKFLMELAGGTMIGRAVGRLASQVATMAISANCDPALLSGLHLPVLADPPPSRGPLSGIQAGLAWAQSRGCSHIVTAASDTPFFPSDLVTRLADAASSPKTVVLAASAGRVHPVFGLWPISLAPALGEFLREGASFKMTDFADRNQWTPVDFAFENGLDPFFNVNTMDDLAEAARLMRGGK